MAALILLARIKAEKAAQTQPRRKRKTKDKSFARGGPTGRCLTLKGGEGSITVL